MAGTCFNVEGGLLTALCYILCLVDDCFLATSGRSTLPSALMCY